MALSHRLRQASEEVAEKGSAVARGAQAAQALGAEEARLARRARGAQDVETKAPGGEEAGAAHAARGGVQQQHLPGHMKTNRTLNFYIASKLT